MPKLAGSASAAVSTWVFVVHSALCCLDQALYLQMFFKCAAVRRSLMIWRVPPAKKSSLVS